MVKLFLAYCVTVTIGLTGVLGYNAYKALELDLKPADRQKRAEARQKVTRSIGADNLYGIMWGELADRKSKAEVGNEKFDLENAEILKAKHNPKSDKLVVYMRDIHYDRPIQDKAYDAIDEIRNENKTTLLGLEGMVDGEVTRESLADEIGFGGKLMTLLLNGFWTPKDREQAMQAFSGAGYAYEYVNGKAVDSCGLEDEDVYNAAKNIAYTPVKSEGAIEIFKVVVSDMRSRICVEKMLKQMDSSGSKKALFIYGAAHTRGIIDALEKAGVSYAIVQPKGLDSKIEELFKDNIEHQ